MRRGDVTWQHGTKVNDKERVRCNFCNKEMGSGIYCLKEHLVWEKGNITGCKEVPPKVKQQMIKIITEGKGKKVQRERDTEEIWTGYESPIDEEDDQEAEFEVQMERARIASIQELNYRQMEIQEMYRRRDCASSSHQPQEHVVPGKGGCGPSLLRSTSSRLRCSFSSRPSFYTFYLQLVASIAEVGPGVRGPTAKELAGPCLEVAVHDDDKHIAQLKVCWPGTGVTIMTDGWKDKSHRYLVNFLIGCPRGIVYHFSIDLSRKRHTERLICAHLDKIVDEVGPENVVKVVTDNAVNYRKAGLLLMERRPNLYWTPCAAHCINLMLKEIGKLKMVKYCILKSKFITRFIYNHTYLHASMREHCMRDIVRESTTRFATAFLTIQSILVNKTGLRLWARYNHVVSVTEPLVRVLRLSDSDNKPAMGLLFDAMRRAREAIFENNIWNEEILEIVAHRFFLNPQNLYSNATLDDADIMEGVRNCIYRLEPDLETQMECMQQVFLCLSLSMQWWTIHGIRTKQNYMPINLDYIFRRDLVDEWVSLRTPLLDQDFLSGAVVDMDDNVNVAASNKGDMTMDMDDDYTQDEDEAQDDKTDGTMENNWQEPVIQEFFLFLFQFFFQIFGRFLPFCFFKKELLDWLKQLTAPVSPVLVQTAPSPKTG
ncbi:hypothetical protein AMTRI_Chr03g141630 [Amborella trichopoda]